MATNDTSMKKIFATRLTDTSTIDKEGIGCLRREGAKLYKWVQYIAGSGNVAAVAGQMTYHDDDKWTSSLCQVTSDLSDTAGVGAGMLMSAPAANEYCWIQVEGIATLALALTAGADGNALCGQGSTDGALDVSALVTDAVCAIAIDASARIVYLKCPH